MGWFWGDKSKDEVSKPDAVDIKDTHYGDLKISDVEGTVKIDGKNVTGDIEITGVRPKR